MKRLVVLVGLPGSGKTAFQQGHPEWAIVSKNAIRRGIFHTNFAPEYEDVVDRVFAATLVEVIASDAEVVCVDDLNLSRDVRAELVELAQLSGREAIAYVMPFDPLDRLFARSQQNREGLSLADPDLRVTALTRDRFDALAGSYDPVDEREGFTRVERDTLPADADVSERSSLQGKAHRRRRIEKREPLPLFVP